MTYQTIAYPKASFQVQGNIKVKLRWFKKNGGTLVGEESIDQLSLHDLQDLFDVYIDNDVYNVWYVRVRHARWLQDKTEHKISLNKYSYFIEQESIHDNFNDDFETVF